MEEPKGIRKISTFIPADALLAAVLMVWAQLWIQPSVRLWAAWYGTVNQTENVSRTLQTFDFNVGLGLIWTYYAVFLALLSLLWVALSSLGASTDKVSATPVGLFMASGFIAVIDVGQSIYSILEKVLSDFSIWEPLIEPRWFLPFGAISLLVITAFFVWLSHRMSKARDELIRTGSKRL